MATKTPSVESVRSALKEVIEPVLERDIVSLGMVKKIDIDRDAAFVTLEIPTPVYRDRTGLEERTRVAALKAPGITDVRVLLNVNVPMGNRGAATRLPSVRNVIAVAAGKGGVGKSTVATNLALALREHGARVGLLDADIYGPSVPTMLGEPEQQPATHPGNKIGPAIHFGIPVISVGFFTEREGAVVWRGPMVHKLLQQFLEDVDWGELDYLIVDLPPGTGDAQLSLAQLIPLTGAIIVTTPQEVALIDVRRAVNMFNKLEVPILGVVENMSHYTCPACGHHDNIFASGGGKQLAAEIGVPLLGQVPIDNRVSYGGESGVPVVEGAPNSEQARVFTEIAAQAAFAVSKASATGPKRSSLLRTVT